MLQSWYQKEVIPQIDLKGDTDDLVQSICELVEPQYKVLILFLPKLLSIILYVITCGQKINLFDQLCKDFILNLNHNFP